MGVSSRQGRDALSSPTRTQSSTVPLRTPEDVQITHTEDTTCSFWWESYTTLAIFHFSSSVGQPALGRLSSEETYRFMQSSTPRAEIRHDNKRTGLESSTFPPRRHPASTTTRVFFLNCIFYLHSETGLLKTQRAPLLEKCKALLIHTISLHIRQEVLFLLFLPSSCICPVNSVDFS